MLAGNTRDFTSSSWSLAVELQFRELDQTGVRKDELVIAVRFFKTGRDVIFGQVFPADAVCRADGADLDPFPVADVGVVDPVDDPEIVRVPFIVSMPYKSCAIVIFLWWLIRV
ncbi:MAG: hypothetical protein IJT60_05465 [Clostridia bacterium]|nr:hypothetical protein [Clostridia bacterium]